MRPDVHFSVFILFAAMKIFCQRHYFSCRDIATPFRPLSCHALFDYFEVFLRGPDIFFH